MRTTRVVDVGAPPRQQLVKCRSARREEEERDCDPPAWRVSTFFLPHSHHNPTEAGEKNPSEVSPPGISGNQALVPSRDLSAAAFTAVQMFSILRAAVK